MLPSSILRSPRSLCRYVFCSLLVLAALLWQVALQPASGAEIVRLTPDTWRGNAPRGKEADCIYGDYVLKNDRIVCVVADPIPTRNANMTVRNVGGCVIDLTLVRPQRDQLSCYYPGGVTQSYQFHSARAGDQPAVAEQTESLQLQGETVELTVAAEPIDGVAATVTYRLSDGEPYVRIISRFENTSDSAQKVELVDSIRADRSFEQRPGGAKEQLYWVYDRWFRQAYGVLSPGRPAKATGGRAVAIRFADEAASLPAGESLEVERLLFPANDLFRLQAIAARVQGHRLRRIQLNVTDKAGEAVRGALVTVKAAEGDYTAQGRTGGEGRLALAMPPGEYQLSIEDVGRETVEKTINTDGDAELKVVMEQPGFVAAKVTSADGKAIPCKVQFVGQDGTPDPYFGHESMAGAVHNVVYTANGQFRQPIGPGKYRVIVSYGPEHDIVTRDIEVERGQTVDVEAKLVRSVNTRGWISADFHNHASPSGDNTASQRGRVLNILAEHVEFAPCTEHNRISTYVPHLKALGAEHLVATCTGIEVTGTPLPINHQNAFPLKMKPRTQDGGGPQTDPDPQVQIERLALWDGGSDKLVQQNHPDIGWLFFDRDGDGKPDEGFSKGLPYIDAMEVHPPYHLIEPPVFEQNGTPRNNRIFNWLQLLNQGYRIPGVVNTDSHYNFHESGFWRNYIQSPTDDPTEIKTLDVVHATERGKVVMTTAPFLEVKATTSAASRDKAEGTAGALLSAPNGQAELEIKVQCANWYDIDRVQVYLNGRPDPALNFTRQDNPELFTRDVVRFHQTLPLKLKQDTHVIVMAIGEKSTLGIVQGPRWGLIPPCAVSNPIWIDVDGGDFTPNKDTLGAPLPVKATR